MKITGLMWCVLGLFLLHTIFYWSDEYVSFKVCLSDFSLNTLFIGLPFYFVGRYKRIDYDTFNQ